MIVIDIAIGLVLIYFLYSLLSSIIAEIISSWIGMRARMLKQGIENILNDKKIGTSQDFKKWIQDIFLVEDKNFKYTNAGKFYEEPTIKYLAKPGDQLWYSLKNRKPSYISSENFVITVLNMFSNKGRGISEWDKIKFAVETNALHLEPETLKMFQDLVKRSNDDFKKFVDLLLHHFDDTMDRLNGWYKRKIGTIIFFIGLILCIVLNVDTFQIVNILSNDKEKRLQMVEMAEHVIQKKSKIDSLMSIKDSLEELNYKMMAHAMVKSDVINANDIMATGWEFKIKVQEKRICISDDPFCWGCITKSQAKFVEDSIKLSKGKREKINELKNKIKNNPLIVKDIKTKLDSISLLEYEIKQITKSIQDTIGLCFIEFDNTYRKNHNFWIKGQAYPSFTAKAKVILKAMLPWKSKFWGIVLTALALTLGAQFWFDLLKKLVSLRSAGVKPEESVEKKRQVTQIKLEGEKVTSKDPVEIAISQNRAYWESLPGFIGLDKKNENGATIIELFFQEGYNPEIKDKLKVTVMGEFYVIKINLKKGSIPNLQLNPIDVKIVFDYPDYTIYNSYNSILGSPCGMVKNIKTNKYAILTCAHVIKTDKSGFLSETNNDANIILNKSSRIIGKIKNINLSSFSDAALIDIDNNLYDELKANIKPISFIRDLTDDDLNNTKCKIKSIRYSNKVITGLIDSINKQSILTNPWDYSKYNFHDLINIKCIESYTEVGDSGSLVTDENDVPIGIIVGGGKLLNSKGEIEYYSLAMKLSNICNILNSSLIN